MVNYEVKWSTLKFTSCWCFCRSCWGKCGGSFEETVGFDVKALFATCPVLCLIRWYIKPCDITWFNTRLLWKGYSVPWDFSWIENYKLNPTSLGKNIAKKVPRKNSFLYSYTSVFYFFFFFPWQKLLTFEGCLAKINVSLPK